LATGIALYLRNFDIEIHKDSFFGMNPEEYKSNKPEFEEIVDEGKTDGRFLILHNDDVHSFDYVINTLIEVCNLEAVQAEQCTFLVHYKGKCDVKKGAYELLKPYRQGLIERELNATID
jgi:ATP-dependent Clp protease adaptor protein ClpS